MIQTTPQKIKPTTRQRVYVLRAPCNRQFEGYTLATHLVSTGFCASPDPYNEQVAVYIPANQPASGFM